MPAISGLLSQSPKLKIDPMPHYRLPLLLVATAVIGCSKGTVLPSQGSSDASGKGGSPKGSAPIAILPDASPRDGQPEPDVACSRSVNLRGISITRPVPFDVVIVADNTDSLSWSGALSAGLQNLLAQVSNTQLGGPHLEWEPRGRRRHFVLQGCSSRLTPANSRIPPELCRQLPYRPCVRSHRS
jgi:hypothetical protein